jgi:hypothetical protein
MKLLLENWRKYLNEDWRDTSWEDDDEKVTIGQVVDYLGDETVNVNVSDLSQQLPELPTRGAARVAAANLDYPIIVVKSGGQYKYVLDGNHRLQKAIDEGVETIKAKVLDLSDPEPKDPKTLEKFKRMFGGASESNKRTGILNSNHSGEVYTTGLYSSNMETATAGVEGQEVEIISGWQDQGVEFKLINVDGIEGWVEADALDQD